MITFRKFDKNDWNAFSGCESDQPMIADHDNFVLIVDGDSIEVIMTMAEGGDDWAVGDQVSFRGDFSEGSHSALQAGNLMLVVANGCYVRKTLPPDAFLTLVRLVCKYAGVVG